MPQIQYPFIDIAVHPAVRSRFAAGEAMVLLSGNLTEVQWANGEGARLFGYDNIYDFIDIGPDHQSVQFRQLAASARQLSTPGDKRSLVLRVRSGFSSRILNASVEMLEIRPGNLSILFSSEVVENAGADARLRSMLLGFDDPDTHIAVLDGEGSVMAASEAFGGLGISSETIRSLIAAEARSPEGLIKRPVASSQGYMPAAIGKVSDNPSLHLLFLVETVLGRMDAPQAIPESDRAEKTTGEAKAEVHEGSGPADQAEEPNLVADIASSIEPFAEEDVPLEMEQYPATESDFEAGQPIEDAVEPSADEVQPFEQELESPETADTADVALESPDLLLPTDGFVPDDVVNVEVEASPIEPADQTTGDSEEVSTSGAEASDVPPETGATEPGQANPAAREDEGFAFLAGGRPVRFVWKLDASGRFTEVSDEFAATVGPRVGDIVGLTFADLCVRFDLDPENEILRLLERRDTWSGRTVRWPVEGTGLVVPVDLAALPTYSRNREFDGFRGFGIIRVPDAEDDPYQRGITLYAQPDEIGEIATSEDEVVADESSAVNSAGQSDISDDRPAEPVEAMQPADQSGQAEALDFQGEVPALKFTDTPLSEISSKIYSLEERRARVRDGLSQSEQAAFKEIGRRLESFGKRPNELVEPAEPQDGPDDTQSSMNTPDGGPIGEEAETVDASSDTGVLRANADIDGGNVAEAQIEPQGESDIVALPVRSDDSDRMPFVAAASSPDDEGYLGLTVETANQIPLAMLIHAGDRLVHANTEFLKFTGFETIEQLEVAGGIETLISREDDPEGGVYMVRADGNRIPVTARLQSIRFEGAKLLMLALAPVTVKETVAIEEDEEAAHRLAALQVEADELKSILETATDGVIVLDMDGRIRSMNRSASALFNYDAAETSGKPFAMLFAHESQRSVQDYLSGLAGHGVASVLNDGREVIGREASGGFIPLFMAMGRMPGSNSYCAVIRDITQWKRSEEELRAAKRAAETANQHKSDFLARVSHEIRTPLNAIIGFSDMIASEHFGPAGHPRYVEYANDIGRSGRHVLDIVNDLLDISKIEAGEMDLEFSAVGINDCISEAVSLVQQQANQQRVIIRTSLSQSVPDVVADLRSIKQIAINVLANSIRFTPSGGQIVVSTAYESNGSVSLRIRDTGIGMTKAELDQAMRPFGQVSPGARKRGEGTGLGLPLTKAMTEANRAQFNIQSAPNEGTLVEIIFPPQRVLAD